MANNGAAVWYGKVNEDGPYSVLARVTSLDGTGTEVVRGEGNPLKQADVLTITAKVFRLAYKDDPAGTEVTPAPTLTPAANLFDTLRTVGWALDDHGYNFRHDVGPEFTAEADTWYLVEYLFTLTAALNSGKVWLEARVLTLPKQTS